MVSGEISMRAWSAMRRDLVPGFCWKSAEFVVDLFE
jgi:hypothetical protein